MSEIKLYEQARTEVLEVLNTLVSGPLPQRIALSSEVDKLTGLGQQISTRRLAASTLGSDPEEVKLQLIDDLIPLLHNITSAADALNEQGTETYASLNLETANTLYNQRAGVLDGLIRQYSGLQGSIPKEPLQLLPGSQTEYQEWVPLESIRGKNQEELVGIIARNIPVDKQIDEDLGGLLAFIIRGVHNEPALQQFMSDKQSLMERYPDIRAFAESQPLRDAVAASFAPLLAKLLAEQPVYAFDDTWRALYASVFGEVKKYYLTQPAAPAPAVQPSTPPKNPVQAQADPTPAESTRIPVGTGASQPTPSPTPAQPAAPPAPATPPVAPVPPVAPTQPGAAQITVQGIPQEQAQPVQPPTPPAPTRPPIKPIDLP